MSGLSVPAGNARGPTPVRAANVAPQPWRNGGGRTRELFAWPPGPDWHLRISLADIDVDGAFSVFPGVRRWFAVIEGGGVVLSLGVGERRLTTASEPLCFDGAEPPGCRLVEGSTRDLNLMLRGGANGCLQRAVNGTPWHERWAWRACFTTGPARWHDDRDQTVDLEPQTLLCNLGPAPCRLFASDPSAPMFWIGADIDPGAHP